MQKFETDALGLAIQLVKSSWGRAIESRRITFTIPADDDFVLIRDAIESAGIVVSDDEKTRRVEIALPPQFFFGMSDFLQHPGRRTAIPSVFYLHDVDYLHGVGDVDAPEIVRKYFDAVGLFQLLSKVADHVIDGGGAYDLVFLGREKVVITSEYVGDDLRELSEIDLFRREFIDSHIHGEQKVTILKAALHELFKTQSKIPFRDILAQFDELTRRANNGYQLYVSEFSFEKVKAEVEKEKTEFTARLNKVFSDIQNQLLAVPVALILVGGQMKDTGQFEVANLLIWAGVLVFAILMSLLIRNQKNTLQVVHQEFLQQRDRIKGNHKGVAEQFMGAYLQLEGRYAHQCSLLLVVDGLVALSLGVATFLFVQYSRPLF